MCLEDLKPTPTPPYSNNTRPSDLEVAGCRGKAPIYHVEQFNADLQSYDPAYIMPECSRSPLKAPLYDPYNQYPGFLLQPDSRSISQGQLVSEVNCSYAVLTMVETICINV
ncbi:hypothetical protein BKA66DRAFT_449546, partial [Pyrenochaeta sp. MPI-SDFR-AT-0127]